MSGDTVSADLGAFETFQTTSQKSLLAFGSNMSDNLTGVGSPIIGMNSTLSGTLCRMTYFQTFDQLSGVLPDITKGGLALSQGAYTIGVKYSNSDMDAKAQLKVVGEAFAPTKGQQSTGQMFTDARKSATKTPLIVDTKNALSAATDGKPVKANLNGQTQLDKDMQTTQAHRDQEALRRCFGPGGKEISLDEFEKHAGEPGYTSEAGWEDRPTIPKPSQK